MISERFQVPPRPPTETNNQGNLLVINTSVGAEKKIRTIKAALHPESRILNTWTFMGMPEGKT